MRHRLQCKVFDGGGNRSSSPQKSRTPSTFTHSYNGKNPHLTKSNNKLHSKSTYFYRWSSRLSYVVPSVCTLALLIGGIITINPILNNIEKVNAEEGIATTSDTPPTISINLAAGDASASRRTPATAGEVTYRTDVFTVGGVGITHYAASLNTSAGKTGELVGKNNPYAIVGKVADGTAPADFEENTWGYAITNDTATEKVEETLTYNPIPSGMDSSNNSVEIARRMGIDKTTTVADSYKIAFAANLGKNLPTDDYMADIYLSVVASPQATISNITIMQEMNSNVCAESIIGETKQLTDARKDASGVMQTKKYWVAKLADDNCWMTQNLDFDIPATLSEEDSDVTGTNVATGITGPTAITGWLGSGDTENRYNDPGDYYYNGPDDKHSQGTACGTNSSTTDLSNCNQFSTTGDAHYHIGNYYTWDAATVKSRSGDKAASNSYNPAENAPMSICPKGWQLPTNNNTDAKSFNSLMLVYGIMNSTLTTSNGSLFGNPLYLVYGGNLSDARLVAAGNRGRYWSSTPSSGASSAYIIAFDNSIAPSTSGARFAGFSVRCVAK